MERLEKKLADERLPLKKKNQKIKREGKLWPQNKSNNTPKREHREAELEKYRKAALAREEYLLRRQRKEALEHCRRVAIVGARSDPNGASYVQTEKLLGLGVEVFPVAEDCRTYVGAPCYRRLLDIPGAIDVVQVYSGAR